MPQCCGMPGKVLLEVVASTAMSWGGLVYLGFKKMLSGVAHWFDVSIEQTSTIQMTSEFALGILKKAVLRVSENLETDTKSNIFI